ncbi:MAG: hypothetical protein V7L11_30195 [Nostoc sp.]
MGTGDWGLGGHKGQVTPLSLPNPQSPIPNPQSPIPNIYDSPSFYSLDS